MDPRQDDGAGVPIGRLDGRSDRLRAAVVVGAIALVVVIGLASAQLRPEVTPPAAIVSIEPSASMTNATPSPSTSIAVSPPRLRAAELVEAVLSGSLADTMVYADATLDVECGDAHRPCDEPTLAVEGLALDIVSGTFGTPVGIPLPGSLLVLEVQETGLVYRGALIVHANGTPRYEGLAGGSAARPSDPSALTDVAGWLMLDRSCTRPPSAFLPCTRLALMADERPTPTGPARADAGNAVVVPHGAWGIDDAGPSIVKGPFLVRPNPAAVDGAPAWEIVARYDPSRSVRIVIP